MSPTGTACTAGENEMTKKTEAPIVAADAARNRPLGDDLRQRAQVVAQVDRPVARRLNAAVMLGRGGGGGRGLRTGRRVAGRVVVALLIALEQGGLFGPVSASGFGAIGALRAGQRGSS